MAGHRDEPKSSYGFVSPRVLTFNVRSPDRDKELSPACPLALLVSSSRELPTGPGTWFEDLGSASLC